MLMIRSASAASLLTIGLWANVAGAETGSPPIPNFDVRAACNSLQKCIVENDWVCSACGVEWSSRFNWLLV